MITPENYTIAQYTAAIQAGNTQHVKVVFPNQNITIDEGHIAVGGWNYTSIINGETDVSFGKAVSAEIIVTLFNFDGSLSGITYTDTFKAYMGVEIEGTTAWVCIGTFIGQQPERTKDVHITLRGLDKISLFDADAKYFLTSIDYTATQTIRTIFYTLCAKFGLTPDASMANSLIDTVVSDSPFGGNGVTYRDVLAWIAEACGCYARVTPDGNVLQLVWFTDQTGYTLTKEKYFSIDVAEYTVPPVDCVTCIVSDKELTKTYPDLNEANSYTVADNPYLYTDSAYELNTFAQTLYNRLSAFSAYKPTTVSCVGNWLVQAGDIISCTEMDGVTTDTLPIFSINTNFNGMAIDQYQSTGNAESRSVFSGNSDKQLIRNNYNFSLIEKQISSIIENHCVYFQSTDPTVTYTVAKGDFWITFNGAKWSDLSAKTWQQTYDMYSSWGIMLGDSTTYCWNGFAWILVSDIANEESAHATYFLVNVDDATGELLVTTTSQIVSEMTLSVDGETGQLNVTII